MAKRDTSLFFDQLEKEIVADLGEALDRDIAALSAKIEEAVTKEVEKLFQILAVMGVDVAAPPNLGRYSKSWVALNDKYVQQKLKKRRRPRSANFYIYDGILRRFLNSSSPMRFLGEPTVTDRVEKIGTPGFRMEKVRNVRARRGFNIQSRNRRGRFGSLKDVFRQNVRLEIDPFPLIPDDADANNFEASVLGPDAPTKTKGSVHAYYAFRNPKGRTLRPLFTPFIKWYVRYKIEPIVDKVLNNG